MKYVTPYQYAKLCGLTRQAIYNRINKGTLEIVVLKEAEGITSRYIYIDAFPPCRKPWSGGRPKK
jgi:hypothetical protein